MGYKSVADTNRQGGNEIITALSREREMRLGFSSGLEKPSHKQGTYSEDAVRSGSL